MGVVNVPATLPQEIFPDVHEIEGWMDSCLARIPW
jgi:hypothetical protein